MGTLIGSVGGVSPGGEALGIFSGRDTGGGEKEGGDRGAKEEGSCVGGGGGGGKLISVAGGGLKVVGRVGRIDVRSNGAGIIDVRSDGNARDGNDGRAGELISGSPGTL